MSSIPSALPAHTNSPAPVPAKTAPKPPAAPPPAKAAAVKAAAKAAEAPPRPAEHHAASTLSPADVGYVDSLLGTIPPQAMEYILLKTGIPQPANLGQDVDTTA